MSTLNDRSVYGVLSLRVRLKNLNGMGKMVNDNTERFKRGQERAASARERMNHWFSLGNCPRGLVLTGQAAVSWFSGGMGQPLDRATTSDIVWIVVTAKSAAMITSQVETDRIRDEYRPSSHGFDEVISVPWFEPDAFVRAAEDYLGSEALLLASDGNQAFGDDVSDELVSLRLGLSVAEKDDIKDLAADATFALEEALKLWRPGERDFEIQSRIELALGERGAHATILIVGGDERVVSYRHPIAVGAQINKLLMGVVVARREGLHVAATRFASRGRPDDELIKLRKKVLRIDAEILSACVVGDTYGSVLDCMDKAYIAEGFEGGWKGHYQGGPIGFMQREFEIAPLQSDSRWYKEEIGFSHAVAWNPSLPGGAKVEDTYLIGASGVEGITRSRDWPVEPNDQDRFHLPAILEI